TGCHAQRACSLGSRRKLSVASGRCARGTVRGLELAKRVWRYRQTNVSTDGALFHYSVAAVLRSEIGGRLLEVFDQHDIET
ncbi:MAG TPA: hypothetical protein VIR01_20655, partial [Pyrinomonadaceae bacterium]